MKEAISIDDLRTGDAGGDADDERESHNSLVPTKLKWVQEVGEDSDGEDGEDDDDDDFLARELEEEWG